VLGNGASLLMLLRTVQKYRPLPISWVFSFRVYPFVSLRPYFVFTVKERQPYVYILWLVVCYILDF